MILRVLILASLAILSGCASLSTMHTAHVVPKGESKVSVSTTVVGGGVPGLSIATGQPPPFHQVGFPVPQAEVELRHGFAERWDWGLRFYLLGAASDVKFQFVQGRKWDAAFAPGTSLSYAIVPGGSTTIQTGEVDVVLPVLFGRRFGKESSFVFGPKAQGRLSFSDFDTPEQNGRGTRFILLAGGGGVLNLAVGRGWSVPLELSIYNDWTEKTGVAYSAGFGVSLTTSPGKR